MLGCFGVMNQTRLAYAYAPKPPKRFQTASNGDIIIIVNGLDG